MFLSLILAAATLASVKPVLELDYTKGTLPPNTVSAVSKKFKDNFDKPKFVKDGKEYALFCGGKNQYGHFTMTDKPPFKADAPFTITCSFKPRGGWLTPVIYYRNHFYSKEGFTIMQSGPQLNLHIGKKYVISSDKANPLQKNTSYFVTVSWDGKVWKMTLNGREFTGKENPPFILPKPDVKLHVGGYNINTNNIFEGTIRKVKIYDKALSMEEIFAIFEQEISEQEDSK